MDTRVVKASQAPAGVDPVKWQTAMAVLDFNPTRICDALYEIAMLNTDDETVALYLIDKRAFLHQAGVKLIERADAMVGEAAG